MYLLIAAAMNVATLPTSAMCDKPGPGPIAFHSRGFSHVAEVFPAKARRNSSDVARLYMYEVGYPGATWSVDARRRWIADLPVMPQAAIVSMAGHVILLDEYYQGGGDHSLVVFSTDGKQVKSFSLDQLLAPADVQKVTVSDCGLLWRDAASFYFSDEPDAKLYVVLRWGRAVEVSLGTGAIRRGSRDEFATLRAILAQRFPNELAEVWPNSLRFSSLTDMMPPR